MLLGSLLPDGFRKEIGFPRVFVLRLCALRVWRAKWNAIFIDPFGSERLRWISQIEWLAIRKPRAALEGGVGKHNQHGRTTCVIVMEVGVFRTLKVLILDAETF
jgi:hypothetical protein